MNSTVKKGGVVAVSIIMLGTLAGTAYAHGPFGYNLTDEQKEVLEEARDLRQEGEFEAAQDLLEANDLDRDSVRERAWNRYENRNDAHNAVEANDYAAYQVAVAGTPREEITAEQFAVLVQAHELREAGDFDGAHELMEGLGFERMGNGPQTVGRGHGMYGGGMRGNK